jgi:hypothetical protein
MRSGSRDAVTNEPKFLNTYARQEGQEIARKLGNTLNTAKDPMLADQTLKEMLRLAYSQVDSPCGRGFYRI